MEKVFLKFAVPERPIILFIDGHKSHINLDVVDMARNNNVILFCLPPHTTHALQPLDVAVFKSFKNHFSKAVKALSFAKKNFVVSKRDFARVVKDPFEQAFSIPNIKAGFRKSRIFPFNRNAVDQSKMLPSTLHDLSDATSSSQTGSSSEPSHSSSRTSMTPVLFSSPSSDSVAPMSTSSSLHSPDSDNSISIPSTNSNSSYTLTCDTPTANSASNDCSDAELSVLAPNTPSPIVSLSGIDSSQEANPTTVANTPPNDVPSSTGITNPLVQAGLIPAHLADILATPPANAATQRRVRRITKARVLTAREYVEMMEEKEKKEKEAAELKQKRKEERERKKLEREKEKEQKTQEMKQKKQEREKKKLEREQEKERRKQEMDQKKRDREQKQQEKGRAEKKRKCTEKLQQAPKSKYKCTMKRVRQDIESDESQSDDSQSDDSQSDDSQSEDSQSDDSQSDDSQSDDSQSDESQSDDSQSDDSQSDDSQSDESQSDDSQSDDSQSDDSQSDDSQSEDSQSDRECVPESSRPSRKIRLPSRFRDSSDADSDDDAVLCDLCQAREPEGCKQVPYFWIDCNSCGKWVHTYCAFGRNNVTRQYLCEHCI